MGDISQRISQLSKKYHLMGSHMGVLCFLTFFHIALTNFVQRFIYKQTKNWHEDSSHTSSKAEAPPVVCLFRFVSLFLDMSLGTSKF